MKLVELPATPKAWRRLIEDSAALTSRERDALLLLHVDARRMRGPYLHRRVYGLRQAASHLGVSKRTFARYVQSAEFKLRLTLRAPIPRRSVPVAVQKALLEKLGDDSYCDVCGRTLLEGKLSVDHVVPRVFGGTDELANLRLVHKWCNSSDGARYAGLGRDSLPLGYKRASTVRGRKVTRRIEVDSAGARIVRFLFDEYATGKHTLASLSKALAHSPLVRSRSRVRRYMPEQLLEVLHETCYRKTRSDPYRAQFPPLVDDETWLACARLLRLEEGPKEAEASAR